MLSIVATPIGNLSDISYRAVETLTKADLILCEDTRITGRLLEHYGITTRMKPLHQHSAEGQMRDYLDMLAVGKHLALVTDAGTPGISDPGNQFVSLVVKELPGVQVTPIPGPSAIIAALSISGFPTDKFIFYGFIPHKKGREKLFKEIISADYACGFYESTHRIIKTLEKLNEMGLKKNIIVCRELTKKFETIYRGTISDVIEKIKSTSDKGEFVVIVNPS